MPKSVAPTFSSYYATVQKYKYLQAAIKRKVLKHLNILDRYFFLVITITELRHAALTLNPMI